MKCLVSGVESKQYVPRRRESSQRLIEGYMSSDDVEHCSEVTIFNIKYLSQKKMCSNFKKLCFCSHFFSQDMFEQPASLTMVNRFYNF